MAMFLYKVSILTISISELDYLPSYLGQPQSVLKIKGRVDLGNIDVKARKHVNHADFVETD